MNCFTVNRAKKHKVVSKTACLSQAVPKILSGAEVDHCRYSYLLFTVCIQMDAPVLPFIPIPFEDLDQDLLFQFRPVFAFAMQQLL